MNSSLDLFDSKKSLKGKTLVVTRALTQAGSLSDLLKNLGAEVIEYPCIEIEVLSDLGPKILGLGDFSQFTDVVFSSINAVSIFFQALDASGQQPSILKGKTFFAVGPKTNDVLKGYGFQGCLIPSEYQAEGILKLFPENLRGRTFLLPRAKNARELIPDEIRKRGGECVEFLLYESVAPKNLLPIDFPHDGICFTSASTVVNYAKHSKVREGDVAFVIGHITAKSAQDAGFKKIFMAEEALIEGLVEKIKRTLSIFLIFLFTLGMSLPSFATDFVLKNADKKLGALVFFPWNEDWNSFMYPNGDTLDRDMSLLKDAGLDWVRLDFLWDKIEPKKGEWDFRFYDSLVQKIEEHHLHVLGVLGYSALWANSEHRWNKPPDRVEDYARFVSIVLKRYPKIFHWEFWNEPNLAMYWDASPWESLYVPLLKCAYVAAKEANPTCVILHGGLAQGVEQDLEALYLAHAKGFFDGVNIHPFLNPIDLEKRPLTKAVSLGVDQVLAVMKKYGDSDKKIWITEIGCPGRVGDPWNPKNLMSWFLGETPTLEKQSQFAEDVVVDLIQHPQVEAVFWAFFRDTRHFKEDTDYLGLVDWEGHPKPAYVAIKNALCEK